MAKLEKSKGFRSQQRIFLIYFFDESDGIERKTYFSVPLSMFSAEERHMKGHHSKNVL